MAKRKQQAEKTGSCTNKPDKPTRAAKQRRTLESASDYARATKKPEALANYSDPKQLSAVLPSSMSIKDLTKAELKEACAALYAKILRTKQGRRQWGRRLKSEPFRLSDSQKMLFVNSYKAARNEGRPMDYVRLSNSCHFTAFLHNPDVLASKEGEVLEELKEALVEQRKLDAGMRMKTSTELEEELTSVHVLHEEQIAEMEGKVKMLEQRLADSEKVTEGLRSQLALSREANIDTKRRTVVERQRFVSRCEEGLKTREDSLLKKEMELKNKFEELSTQSAQLHDQQAELQQQACNQDDERHRLERQIALKEQMERRHQQDITREQDEKVEWQRQQRAIVKEMERLVVELEDQKYWNGYAPAIDAWRRRWEVEQEMRKAAQAALEATRQNETEMNNRIARLDLIQASYEACGSTEHCIAQFAEQNANPKYDDITTTKKQRNFAARIMKRIHYARGIELEEDLHEFGETRNHLCHDRNGTGLDTISHERFQSLCRKIKSIITSM